MPFFVTVIRDAKVGVLAGPFDDREEAEGYVEPTREAARDLDPLARFDSFGVSLIPGRAYPGSLNERLGLLGPISFGVWLEGTTEHYHSTQATGRIEANDD